MTRFRLFGMLGLVVATFVTVSTASADTPTYGKCTDPSPVYRSEDVKFMGIDPTTPQAAELVQLYTDLVKASNDHRIEDVLKFYNPKFISGDNLTLEQIKHMIQDTWKAYPGICYSSKPVEIRVTGDWATIETQDHSYAIAPPDKEIMDVPGKMESQSRSLLFLRRLGTSWEITSDSTVWEEAVIRYGIDDKVNITLSAPEQVKAGETYSAKIQADIPEGSFTIATIDNQPTIYPYEKSDDKFRSLNGANNELQRVLTANSTNHNEIVTATVGLTHIDQNQPDRPSLSLNGIITLVKRVNIVPISSEDVKAAMEKQEVVKISADGQYQVPDEDNRLTNRTPVITDLEDLPNNIVPAPTNPELEEMQEDDVPQEELNPEE